MTSPSTHHREAACLAVAVLCGALAKFWRSVDTSGGPDACWPWLAGRLPLVGGNGTRGGYGQLCVIGVDVLTHRFSYQVNVGPIPPKMDVRHKCDFPPCANPRHLHTGTRKQNLRDAVERGRIAAGSRHGRSKLLEADVLAIRAAVAAGERQIDVARRFGISDGHVSEINARKTWGHL